MTDTPHPVRHRHRKRHPGEPDMIPPILIKAMFGLVALCLALVTVYVLTEQPVISTPPQAEVVATRTLYLDADMSGAAVVRDADGGLIADLGPEEGGFVSGVARVIERERTKHRVALDGPVTLTVNKANRLTLHDPSTGWSADLMGFGIDNARAFAALLAKP